MTALALALALGGAAALAETTLCLKMSPGTEPTYTDAFDLVYLNGGDRWECRINGPYIPGNEHCCTDDLASLAPGTGVRFRISPNTKEGNKALGYVAITRVTAGGRTRTKFTANGDPDIKGLHKTDELCWGDKVFKEAMIDGPVRFLFKGCASDILLVDP